MRYPSLLAFGLAALLATPAAAQDAPDYGASLDKHIGRAAASEIRRSVREAIPDTGIRPLDQVARGVAQDYSRAAADAVRGQDEERRIRAEQRRQRMEERGYQREMRRAEREMRKAERERQRAAERGE